MVVKDEKKLEDILIKLGLLTEKQLNFVKVESAETGKPLVQILKETQKIPEEELCKVIAINLGIPYVDLTKKKISQDILVLIDRKTAEKYKVIPFGQVGDFLSLAMVDPNDIVSIEYVSKKTGHRVKPYLMSATSMKNALNQYEGYSVEVDSVLSGMEGPEEQADDKRGPKNTLDIITQDAPITRALNTIMEYAAKSRASDIHIEPREKDIKIRYRVDGILYETMTLPKHIHPALVSRVKIMSNLKIDEHRVPQDGRFQMKFEDRGIDLRISITPIIFGEKIVMRLLDKSGGVITLENLGLKGKAYKIIDEGTKKPHGMTLVTGPTGSGKSTSLYAVLTKLNTPKVNIITVEDPVEYNINGINQIQVNSAVGLTFASGLRSILRQDPDIIMVGEIRDKETAELAVQSALTGHTVLSTLHTNSAAGALPRLLEMAIEPFLIASTVNTVIAQRLVRKICEECKVEYKISPNLTKAIKASLKGVLPSKKDPIAKTKDLGFDKIPFEEDETFSFYKGKGCDACKNTGFYGRMGIFEVFSITPKIEDLIISRASSHDIQELAVSQGMVKMRQDGFLKVLAGMTTIEEVVRTASEE